MQPQQHKEGKNNGRERGGEGGGREGGGKEEFKTTRDHLFFSRLGRRQPRSCSENLQVPSPFD